jgi:hypothetical protein
MRISEYYESIKRSADIECAVCGRWYDTSHGQCGAWAIVDGEWKHWCASGWKDTRRVVREAD